jgi:hypothetical protein
MNRSPVRRLRHGVVTVELLADSTQVLMRCAIHQTSDLATVGCDSLGAVLLEFFRAHRGCSPGAVFDVEYS